MEERGQVAATLQMIKAIFCRGFLAKTRRACVKIQGGLEAKLLRFPCDDEDEREEDDDKPVDDYGIDEQANNDLEEDVAAIAEFEEEDKSEQSHGNWLVDGEVLEKDEIRDKDWSNEEEKKEEEESFAEGNAGDLCENCQVKLYCFFPPKNET